MAKHHYAQTHPETLPWGELEADGSNESTGFFRDAEGMGKHIKAGAKNGRLAPLGILKRLS